MLPVPRTWIRAIPGLLSVSAVMTSVPDGGRVCFASSSMGAQLGTIVVFMFWTAIVRHVASTFLSERSTPELRDVREAWELLWEQLGSSDQHNRKAE